MTPCCVAHVLPQVVVIGGGYIGLEVAAGVSLHPGVSVTMVFPETHLMARLFNTELAAFYEVGGVLRGMYLPTKGVFCLSPLVSGLHVFG
jgi:NADPH-dependent 2,4-dienoyl-CoA reductase/sulfur reductase-like enzyme